MKYSAEQELIVGSRSRTVGVSYIINAREWRAIISQHRVRLCRNFKTEAEAIARRLFWEQQLASGVTITDLRAREPHGTRGYHRKPKVEKLPGPRKPKTPKPVRKSGNVVYMPGIERYMAFITIDGKRLRRAYKDEERARLQLELWRAEKRDVVVENDRRKPHGKHARTDYTVQAAAYAGRPYRVGIHYHAKRELWVATFARDGINLRRSFKDWATATAQRMDWEAEYEQTGTIIYP